MSTHSLAMNTTPARQPLCADHTRTMPALHAFPGLTAVNAERMESDSWTALLRKRLTVLTEHAQVMRQEVDEYLAPVFARFTFTVDPEFHRLGSPSGQRITRVEDLYLTNLDAPNVAAYYAARDQAHRDHGYHLKPGECPALLAEAAVVRAEDALLEQGERYLGCPFRAARHGLRDQALRILMRPQGAER